MSDIPRWLDAPGAAPEVLELLRSARGPRPLDAATRSRSRRRVAALGAVPAAAGVFLLLQHVALGAILGSVLSVAVISSVPSQPAPVATPSAVRSRGPLRSPRVEPLALRAPEPVPSSATSAILAGGAPRAEASTVAKEPDLVLEARLLEQARRLLGSDAVRALAVLEEHERDFPGGALKLEREFLAVDALMRLGRREAAVARAAQLRELAPGSLYEQRLTRLLGDARGGPSSN